MVETEKKSRLEKLKEQQKRLAARIQQAEARTKTSERKKDTRKKILIGSYYLEHASDKKSMAELTELMDSFLKRDNDRALFGLSPLDNSINKQDN